jgi:hypothetical protein
MNMNDLNANPFNRKTLTEDVLHEWQNMLNDAARFLGVPAGLITRVDAAEIEILLSSEADDNPYSAAFKSPYPNSGWYCEYTLKSRGLNLIPNALHDAHWEDNTAAVELNMISYIGIPINLPDGGQFGTVCFIDNKQNAHNDLHIQLVKQIKKMIELSLRIISGQMEIDRRERIINDLSKIYPICSYCKKVRSGADNWVSMQKYILDITGAIPSHGICPDCFERETNNK